MNNASARNIWGDYLDTHLQYAFVHEPRVTSLNGSREDSEAFLKQILSGKKRAITHSLLGLQARKQSLPKIGDFTILTDHNGKAHCILRTVAVRLTPFFNIRDSYSKMDGSASLGHWKKWHWDFFTQELERFGRVPRESMIIVCEIFEKVYPRR